MQLESCEQCTIIPSHHPVILSAHLPQAFHGLGLLTLHDLLWEGGIESHSAQGPGTRQHQGPDLASLDAGPQIHPDRA